MMDPGGDVQNVYSSKTTLKNQPPYIPTSITKPKPTTPKNFTKKPIYNTQTLPACEVMADLHIMVTKINQHCGHALKRAMIMEGFIPPPRK